MALFWVLFNAHFVLLLQFRAALAENPNCNCLAQVQQCQAALEDYQANALSAVKQIFDEEQPCTFGREEDLKNKLRKVQSNHEALKKQLQALGGGSLKIPICI